MQQVTDSPDVWLLIRTAYRMDEIGHPQRAIAARAKRKRRGSRHTDTVNLFREKAIRDHDEP